MTEVTLPSGAVLKIGMIPFDASNNLKKAVLKEMQGIQIHSTRQIMDMCKDYLCLSFASEPVETCLWECMKRCTYNNGNGDMKIEKSTFENPIALGDFTHIQMEIALACLIPFGKGLFAVLQRMLAASANFL